VNPIFSKAIPLLEKIEKAGFEAYFVGGCVRDFILGKEIADVDIATSATPYEIKAIFPKTIDVGIEHGTVVVLFGKETYELTTFRSDGEYTDFRRPSDVKFIRSLEEDLKRRDFTMNSMAMDKKGQIIDPFNGQEAIKNKMIETVGSAIIRFHEDALRMMRAVRFVSQLSFSIELNTSMALKEHASLLEKVSIERKTVEFEKLLNGINRKMAFQLLLDTNLFLYLPGLLAHEKELRKLADFDYDHLSTVEIWSLLLHLMDLKLNEVEAFLRQWKLPIKRIKQIKSIVSWLDFRFQKDWSKDSLYEAGIEKVQHVEKLYNILHHQKMNQSIPKLMDQYDHLIIKGREELAVSGLDLMQWNTQKGGPWVKEQLSLIEKAVLEGEISNQKEIIREWLSKCNLS
jgi:tRNA nucleotidyltransferase (CCA-adding enzyme)